MTIPNLSRDDLAAKYLEQLPYAPYPMQEEALLAWFTSDDGMMICADRNRQDSDRRGRPV